MDIKTNDEKYLRRKEYDKQYYESHKEEINQKKKDRRKGLVPKFVPLTEEQRKQNLKESQKKYHQKRLAKFKELEALEKRLLEKGIEV